MEETMTYIIDISDKRNAIIKETLDQKLLNTKVYTKNIKCQPFDTYIFSPAKKWTSDEALSLSDSTTVICGKINEEISSIFISKNITHKNVMEDEIFTIKNANLTAEGTLSLIIENSPKSIFESNILILGAGRIAKALAILLGRLGVKYSIARFNKEKFPECFTYCNSCLFGENFVNHLQSFDVIVNTIPKVIFDKEKIKKIKKDSILIETASVDCLDRDLVENFTFIHAPALPQRYSAQTAAKIMLESILGENNYV